MSNNSTPKNIRYVSGVSTYNVSPTDDIVNIDTSLNPVTVVLPNIQGSGLMLFRKQFFINDSTSNAATNNISIVGAGCVVNSGQNAMININGGSSIATIVDVNEYQVATDSLSGGGTVTGADNGLNLNGTTVQLGGTLNQPTVITADTTNSFNINDSYGAMLTTRDSLGNWFLANYGYTLMSSQYINDFVSVGNVYDNALIVLNMGSIKNYIGATDVWSFGDYGDFTNSSNVFSIGRFSTIDNSSSVSNIGTGNVIINTSDPCIQGNYNSLISCNEITVLGIGNTISGLSNYAVIGNYDLNLFIDANGRIGNESSMGSALHIAGLQEYIDNADAILNGLLVGDFYRTGDFVKVVH